MLRVLQVIGKMDRAGAESLIMNLYRAVDRTKVQFDFMVFTSEEGDYDQEILELGGRIYHMPSFRGYNYFNLCGKFKDFFEKHPYKVLHGHIVSLSPAYLYYAKKNGAYVIVHSHATKSSVLWERYVFWLLSHRVSSIADYFFACSKQAGIDMFGSEIIEKDNFKVLKNCINVEAFKYSAERHQRLKELFKLEDKVVYGHVGRFTEAKNHQFLIEVFKKLSEKIDKAILLLVGRGELENKIKKIVHEKKLDEKVIFMGVRDDIPDMMNLFDAFVFTSVFEGLGNVCIEAQAAGLPCFVSNAIQNEAIVSNHVWRYSLELSSREWAQQIEEILKTYERKDGRDQVIEAGYDVKNTAENLQRFYLEHSKK